MTRAICRLLHGENRRLFGSCPSLAREYMMKLPAFPPGEHCAESGSCWEDQKKNHNNNNYSNNNDNNNDDDKKQTIHYVLLRVLTRNLALQMYYLPFEVCRLRHSNPGQHRQASFIVHFGTLNKRPYLMTMIHFISHFGNLRFFGKKKNLLRSTQMKTTHCQPLHSFKGPGTLN